MERYQGLCRQDARLEAKAKAIGPITQGPVQRQPQRRLRRKMWKIFLNAWYADITKKRRQSITKKVPAL